MKRKRLVVPAVLFIFTVILWGCKKNESKTTDDAVNESITIGFSIDTFVIERWRRDCDVFIASAKENGAQVIVQNAGNSIEEQIKQIEYLIERNVNVLVIVPKDAYSLTEVVKKARSKNIPVISYDRLICNADISLYISINSRSVGYVMTQALLELQPLGGYYCIYGAKEDFNMSLIDNGVRDALDGEQVTINGIFYTDDWNYDLSYKKMNELLDNGNIPDAVICGNDAIAESVIRSLSEHRLGNSIPVAGQDADIAACRRIAAGTQAVTVYKPITELARIAAEYACSLAKLEVPDNLSGVAEKIDNEYKKVPVVWLEPLLVTADTLKEVVIDSGFHTEQEILRN